MLKLVFCVSILAASTFAASAIEWIDHFPDEMLQFEKFKKVMTSLSPELSDKSELLTSLRRCKYIDADHLAVCTNLEKLIEPSEELTDEALVAYYNVKYLYYELSNEQDEAMSTKLKQIVGHFDALTKRKFKLYFNKPLFGHSKINQALKGISRDNERVFDGVVIQSTVPPPKLASVSDKELLKLASLFQFYLSTFLWWNIAHVAQETTAREDKFRALELLFSALCARIQGPLGSQFNIYNLARTIESKSLIAILAKVPVRFRKLNEYNRICLLWQKEDLREETEVMVRLQDQSPGSGTPRSWAPPRTTEGQPAN